MVERGLADQQTDHPDGEYEGGRERVVFANAVDEGRDAERNRNHDKDPFGRFAA